MKPWLKLYREERGSFLTLPLFARALFAELLKLADENGDIDCGGLDPAAFIARAMGADRSDRRLLRKYLPLLHEDGCIVIDYSGEGRGIRIPNFSIFQADTKLHRRSRKASKPTTTEQRTDHDGATTGARTGHEPTTTEQRPVHGPATTGERTDHETEDKPPKSLGPPAQIRGEEKREEERRVDGDEITPAGLYRRFVETVKRATGADPPGIWMPNRKADAERILAIDGVDPLAELAGFERWLTARTKANQPVLNPWSCFCREAGGWATKREREAKAKAAREPKTTATGVPDAAETERKQREAEERLRRDRERGGPPTSAADEVGKILGGLRP